MKKNLFMLVSSLWLQGVIFAAVHPEGFEVPVKRSRTTTMLNRMSEYCFGSSCMHGTDAVRADVYKVSQVAPAHVKAGQALAPEFKAFDLDLSSSKGQQDNVSDIADDPTEYLTTRRQTSNQTQGSVLMEQNHGTVATVPLTAVMSLPSTSETSLVTSEVRIKPGTSKSSFSFFSTPEQQQAKTMETNFAKIQQLIKEAGVKEGRQAELKAMQAYQELNQAIDQKLINFNQVNQNGDNLLHIALKAFHKGATEKYTDFSMGLIERLLDAGMTEKIDARNKAGQTPLHLAVMTLDPALFKIILDYNPKLDVRDLQGNTPLMLAIKQGVGADGTKPTSPESKEQEAQIIVQLLNKGADPMIPDFQGTNPYNLAKHRQMLPKVLNALSKEIAKKQ